MQYHKVGILAMTMKLAMLSNKFCLFGVKK